MDTKETKGHKHTNSLLGSDEAYYKYVFKKTEKIVCAVFYVLEHADTQQRSTRVASVLEETALATLQQALHTLSLTWYGASRELVELSGSLTSLASTLRVTRAGGLVAHDAADLLALEVEAVVRAVRPYLAPGQELVADLAAEREGAVPQRRPTRGSQSAPGSTRTSSSSSKSQGQKTERQRELKDTLSSLGQASIKDISDRMPQYSEKTLQRELVSLIEQGQVVKEGERRWSRYRLSDTPVENVLERR